MAGFGYFEKWGYQHAVNLANAIGRHQRIDGTMRKVKLIILDDQDQPEYPTVRPVQQLIYPGSC